MYDNQLIKAIIEVMNTGLAAQGFEGETAIPIRQSYQPTQQGTPENRSLFLFKVGDKRYGFLGRKDEWVYALVPMRNPDDGEPMLNPETGDPVINPDTGEAMTIPGTGSIITNPDTGEPIMIEGDPYMRHTERQWYETTFQISGLAIQDPADVDSLTASDIVNIGISVMQSDATRAALRAKNIGILRVEDVRNPYFVDDKGRFEASPSFDFTLTHEQVIISESPIVQSFEANFKRV